MSAWLLVAWIAASPGDLRAIAAYTTQEQCAERALFLYDGPRRSKFRRQFACVEIPAAPQTGALDLEALE